MIKYAVIALVLSAAVACSNAQAPVEKQGEPYIVLASSIDQSAGSITVSIRVDPPANEQRIKSVAEQAISRYSDQYRTVTIKSYGAGSSPSELPFATSILENGTITHQITPRAATQKIPTH
ncbi:MAG TPA: hypothetical protein VJQ56_15740 [Blastocatellia bacterium]|nr:hypothetical protein [Blastocatellia bacterium]